MTHNISTNSVNPRSWLSLCQKLSSHYHHLHNNQHTKHSHNVLHDHHVNAQSTAGSVLPTYTCPDALQIRNPIHIDGYYEKQRLLTENADLRSRLYNARIQLEQLQGRIEEMENTLNATMQAISRAEKYQPVIYAVAPVGKPDPADAPETSQVENNNNGAAVRPQQQIIIQTGNFIDLIC